MINITAIFCVCDDFCKLFSASFDSRGLPNGAARLPTQRSALTTSEVMTIMIGFHLSGFHDLKHFYAYVQSAWKGFFPGLVSELTYLSIMLCIGHCASHSNW